MNLLPHESHRYGLRILTNIFNLPCPKMPHTVILHVPFCAESFLADWANKRPSVLMNKHMSIKRCLLYKCFAAAFDWAFMRLCSSVIIKMEFKANFSRKNFAAYNAREYILALKIAIFCQRSYLLVSSEDLILVQKFHKY